MITPTRWFRALEIPITLAPLMVGLAALAQGRWPAALVLLGISALALTAFEWRLRAHRRMVARVQDALSAAAARDLESPGPILVHGGELVEEISSNRGFAALLASRSTRLYVRGRWGRHEVEIGTAIVAARDSDQPVSYVCVLDPRIRRPFRVMTRSALTSMVRLGLDKRPVPTGDVAFDAGWIVDADEALCRSVLEPRVRAELDALRARLPWFGIASVESTGFGLVVRWPGVLTPEGAAELRDLATEVHRRLAA